MIAIFTGAQIIAVSSVVWNAKINPAFDFLTARFQDACAIAAVRTNVKANNDIAMAEF